MQLVQLGQGAVAQFPDDASPEEIQRALNQEQIESSAAAAQSELKKASLAEFGENVARAAYVPVQLAGRALIGAGGATAAAAEDILHGDVGVYGRPFMPRLMGGPKQTIASPPLTTFEQGGVEVARTLPLIAGGMALQRLGVPSPVAFGALMGSETAAQGGTLPEVAQSFATGAAIPEAGAMGRGAAAKLLTKAIDSGLLSAKRTVAQKAVETIASQGGMQLFMTGLDIPHYASLPPEERRKELTKNLVKQSAWFLMDVPHFLPGRPSQTQAQLDPLRRAAIAMDEATKNPATMDALQGVVDNQVRLQMLPTRTGLSGVTGEKEMVATSQDVMEPHKPPTLLLTTRAAAPTAPVERTADATIIRQEERLPQYPGVAQGTAVPANAPEVRVGEGPQAGDSGRVEQGRVEPRPAEAPPPQPAPAVVDPAVIAQQAGMRLKGVWAPPVPGQPEMWEFLAKEPVTGTESVSITVKAGTPLEDIIKARDAKLAQYVPPPIAPEPKLTPEPKPATVDVGTAEPAPSPLAGNVPVTEGRQATTPVGPATAQPTEMMAEPGESPGRSSAAHQRALVEIKIRTVKKNIKEWEKQARLARNVNKNRRAASYETRVKNAKAELVVLQGDLSRIEGPERRPIKLKEGITEEDEVLFVIAEQGKIPIFMPPGNVASRYARIMQKKAAGEILTSADKNFLQFEWPQNFEDNFGPGGETARAAYEAAKSAGIAKALFVPTSNPRNLHLDTYLDALNSSKGGKPYGSTLEVFADIERLAKAHYERTKGGATAEAEGKAAEKEVRQAEALVEDLKVESKGTEVLLPDDVQVGYQFTLKGAKVKVIEVERPPEEDGRVTSVVLDDGNKYGTTRVQIGEGDNAVWQLRMDEGSLKTPKEKAPEEDFGQVEPEKGVIPSEEKRQKEGVQEVTFAPIEKGAEPTPPTPTTPFSPGSKIRFKGNPQPWTVIAETTDPKFPDERLFRVKNDRTGEETETGEMGIEPITARLSGAAPKPKRNLDAELITLGMAPESFPDQKSKIAAIKRARAKKGLLQEVEDNDPTARGAVELRAVEDLRKAVNDPATGLTPEAAKLVNAFLDSPMAKVLDGLRFRIADTLEHGWQGSYFEGVVELARRADPITGPHEFSHRAWELLPKEVRAQFESMRINAINERLGRPGNAFQIKILEDLRDNPISGGEDFTERGYAKGVGRELYPLSSAEEFFTHALSEKFSEKVSAREAGMITRVKDWLRDMVAAVKKGLGFEQSRDQMLRNIIAGRFEMTPETGIASEQNRRKQQGMLPLEEGPKAEEPPPLRPEEEGRPERFRQIAGVKFGERYVPEQIARLTENIRNVVFDGTTQPVTPERTTQALEILERMINPDTRNQYAREVAQTVDQRGAASMVRNELWAYGVRALMRGDARVFQEMRQRSAEIQTLDAADAEVVGSSAAGLELRLAREMAYDGLWRPIVKYTEEEALAAGRKLRAGPETFAAILRGINDITRNINPDEWDTLIRTGKDSQGRTLNDIMSEATPERQAAREVVAAVPEATVKAAPGGRPSILETVYRWMAQEVTKANEVEFKNGLSEELVRRFTLTQEQANDIAEKTWNRKINIVGDKTSRLLDAELRALDALGEKTAQQFILSVDQAEWKKLERPNAIRDIIQGEWGLKSKLPLDEQNILGFRTALEKMLVDNGLSQETAQSLSMAIWKRRQTDLLNAEMRSRQRAAESKSIRSLIESIKSSPYLAQKDPAWRKETARRWFEANGLSAESARTAAEMFEKQFQNAYTLAAERIAKELLKNPDPRTVQELVAAVRSGLLDPNKEWTAELAARENFRPLKVEDFKRLAELEEKLADPKLSPYEQVAIVEQMMGVMRHAGDQTGHFLKAAGESFAASLLSGIRTSTLQVGQPLAHLLMSWGTHAPGRDFISLTKAALEASKNFIPEFKYAWMKDATAFEAESAGLWKNELKRQFEIAEREWTEKKYHKAIPRFAYAWQQYVIRTLRSFDQAAMAVLREWSMALYGSQAMREIGMNTKQIADMVSIIGQWKQVSYEIFRSEGKTHNEARAMADYEAANQLRNFLQGKEGVGLRRSDEIWEAAINDAFSVTGRRPPGIDEFQEGMLSKPLNQLMHYVSETRRMGGAESIMTIMAVGFMNVPLRAARFYAGWGPYGLLRWGIHNYMQTQKPGAAWLRKGRAGKEDRETFWGQSYKTDLQAKARLREALVGTGLMLAFLGWQQTHSTADDDAEKTKFGMLATGSGPSNKTMRDAWLKRGYRPFSLHVIADGAVRAAIPITRAGQILAYPIGIAAALDDVAWKKKQNEALGKPLKDPVSTKALQMAATYYQIVGAQGIFQAAGHISQLSRGGGGMARAIGTTAAGAASAIAIPSKSLLAGLTDMIYGQVDRSSTGAAIAANVPVLNAVWNGKAINRFGDPVGDRSWYAKIANLGAPITFRVADTTENREMYQLLVSTGAAPPDLRRYIVEEKYGPLTQDEWGRFVKTSGDTLKKTVLDNLPGLKTATPQAVRSFLVKAGEAANLKAAESLNLEAVPRQSMAAGTSGGGGGGGGSASMLPSMPSVPSPAGFGVPSGVSARPARAVGVSVPAGGGMPSTRPISISSARRRVGLSRGRTGGMRVSKLRTPRLRLVSGRLRRRSGGRTRIRRLRTPRSRRLSLKRRI